MKSFVPLLLFLTLSPVMGQEPAPESKGNGKPKAAPTTVEPEFLAPLAGTRVLSEEGLQLDFPDLAEGTDGSLWTAYLSHDGTADTLRLARHQGGGTLEEHVISSPGVLHQPAVAVDGAGGAWVFWGQLQGDDVMSLRARRTFEGKLGGETTIAALSDAGNSFADAATDPSGRVWVVWQEMQPGASRIRARNWSPDTEAWSDPILLSEAAGGHWEPRITFTSDGTAWIVYDSSEGGEFNLRLASVTQEGRVRDRTLLATPEYEARAAIAADAEDTLWITAERGRRQWGLDSRGHENEMGFNAGKRILLARFDPDDGSVTEMPVPAKGRPTPAPDPSPGFAVNVPSLAVTGDGRVWISYRYFSDLYWRVALTAYDPATRSWLEPGGFADSTMGQDRHQELLVAESGDLWIHWPSDRRRSKAPGVSAVHIARVDTLAPWPTMEADAEVFRSPEPESYLNEPTPPRPLTEHHEWTVGGKTYRLVWGDLHRHTDFSRCRTGFDGAALDAYRYAWDIAGLDFLGTSDHTDAAKFYHPYEWWQTQRHVDVFHAPGRFAPLYTYEREQSFPWGHRNIAFAKRGAPVIYGNRRTYRDSPWQEVWPVRAGVDPIHPDELWELLERIDLPCAVISHTGATGMGTDWTRYENGIDHTYENTVEIFQGARVSYEGPGAPQPTVGLRRDEPYTPSARDGKNFPMPPSAIGDFEAGPNVKAPLNRGVYRQALAEGLRLGVFASSDHISAHTSFGGVYVEDFTREGIIAGFKARRTCAATDKIFVEFSCADQPMGSVFESMQAPELSYRILGTAPLKRITIVRNERDLKVIEGGDASLEGRWTDEAPESGENRYYLRAEQNDGNMAWSSPIWVAHRPR